MLISATESNESIKRGRTKRIVGLIAIALIVMFMVLALMGVLSFIEWILAEIIVALIANIIFRNVNRRTNQ